MSSSVSSTSSGSAGRKVLNIVPMLCMLGVSVVGINNQTLNGDVLDVTEFFELYSCDLVGLPAATTSLFNNQNEKKMNKFFSSFASLFKKSSFATETVETLDGASITIEAAGETMAIGDKVFDSEGNAHPDGKVEVQVEDGVLIITMPFPAENVL